MRESLDIITWERDYQFGYSVEIFQDFLLS